MCALIPETERLPGNNMLRTLLIIALPKIGKTEALLRLPNSMLLDFQSGATDFKGMYVDIVGEFTKRTDAWKATVTKMIETKSTEKRPTKPLLVEVLYSAVKELKELKAKGRVFDFLIADPITELQRLALEDATNVYRKSSFFKPELKITDIRLDLDYGGGYNLAVASMIEFYNQLMQIPKKWLIFTAHPSASTTVKENTEITVNDLDLDKKVKAFVTQNIGNIGILYRGDNFTNILSFKYTPDTLYIGARNPLWSNKEFEISRMENGELLTFWENVFPDIKEQPKKQSSKTK